MVGGLLADGTGSETPFSHKGLVAYAGALAMGTGVEECGAADITIWTGDWERGVKYCRLLIEVENNWDELRGTIRIYLIAKPKRNGVFFTTTI